jgi:DNA-binding GntR family transcriptional regulator
MGNPAADPIDAAWDTLRRHLEQRYRERYEAVRSYPTPIARCDEQLTQAIADRDAALAQLRMADDLERLMRRLAAAAGR